MEGSPVSFANRLRELREQKGMSREELAQVCGLGRGTVRDYEQGHREPTLRSAFKLAEALGVSVEEFKDGYTDAADSPADEASPARGRPRKAKAISPAPAPSGQKGKARKRKET
jgi:transcriptional regulator with XRE-family HTH domain